MQRLAAAAFALSLFSVPALAQNPDVVFWQSIQNSTNPAEYQAYLDAFPNGLFANLARIRLANPPLQTVVVGPAPGSTVAPSIVTTGPVVTTTAAPPGSPVLVAPETVVAPATAIATMPRDRLAPGRGSYAAGEPVMIYYADMPPYRGEYIIIVPAGTPDSMFTSPWIQHASNRDAGSPLGDRGGVEFGPLEPGTYEARVFSRAMNADGRWEMIARSSFTVQ